MSGKTNLHAMGHNIFDDLKANLVAACSVNLKKRDSPSNLTISTRGETVCYFLVLTIMYWHFQQRRYVLGPIKRKFRARSTHATSPRAWDLLGKGGPDTKMDFRRAAHGLDYNLTVVSDNRVVGGIADHYATIESLEGVAAAVAKNSSDMDVAYLVICGNAFVHGCCVWFLPSLPQC